MSAGVADYRDRLTARGWDSVRADTLAFAVARLTHAARELADLDDPIADRWSEEVQVLAEHILTDRRVPAGDDEDRGSARAAGLPGCRPVTTTTVKPVRWRAFDVAGVGHAFGLRADRLSACGTVKRPPDEAHDWPRKSKCQRCVRAIEGTD